MSSTSLINKLSIVLVMTSFLLCQFVEFLQKLGGVRTHDRLLIFFVRAPAVVMAEQRVSKFYDVISIKRDCVRWYWWWRGGSLLPFPFSKALLLALHSFGFSLQPLGNRLDLRLSFLGVIIERIRTMINVISYSRFQIDAGFGRSSQKHSDKKNEERAAPTDIAVGPQDCD